jgi:DNA-directed RNA polymerase specialized sigma24 family protein
MPAQTEPASEDRNRFQFTTTNWSVVLAAGKERSETASEALEQLCHTYWYPLYAYVRHRGMTAHEAEDAIQGFFWQLLKRGAFRERTREKGRFRSFLLASLNYYLSDLRDHATAEKRGGNQQALALDSLEAEDRYRYEPVEKLTAEKIFERRWALTLIDAVLTRLESECHESGRSDQFREFRPFIFEEQPDASQLASRLDMTAGATRVALHRLRHRCRELFREEVAQTLNNPIEIDEELRYLRATLSD